MLWPTCKRTKMLLCCYFLSAFYVPGAVPHPFHVLSPVSRPPAKNPMRWVLTHFIDEETEAQRGSVTWPRPHSWRVESQVWSRGLYNSQLSAPNCSEILLPFFFWRAGEPGCMHLPSTPDDVGGGQGARGQSFPSRCRAERSERAQTF